MNGALAPTVTIPRPDPVSIRCVTHTDIDGEDAVRALGAFREITAAWQRPHHHQG